MGDRQSPDAEILSREFGPLEVRVLDALWRRSGPATVKDLLPSFPQTAYTTLMTTLDRLHAKEVLDRVKTGRAFSYRPRSGRDEIERSIAARSIAGLIPRGGDGRSLEPLLSCFVEAVGERDRLALDDLERLLKAKRERLRGGRR
jgi:predicted transcriptional regulator